MDVLHGAVRTLGPVIGRVPVALLLRDPARGADRFGRVIVSIPREAEARVRREETPPGRIRQLANELSMIFVRVRRHLAWILAGVIAHLLLSNLARRRWADAVRGEVEVLLRGLPGNVTTEMDLAVGDLTDLVRPHDALAELLKTRPWSEARTLLPDVDGGSAFLEALASFLDRYGERGAGEIDVSRPRWRDDPSLLIRVITGGLFGREPGAHRRQHEAQVTAGETAERRLAEAASAGFMGTARGFLVRRLARVARIGMGLREHPKFMLVQLLGLVRAEALEAGRTLAQRGQLRDVRDVWHLGFDELARALEDPTLDLTETVAARAADFRRDQAKKPPIVMSSDGETPTLSTDRADLPEGALAGTAASGGVVEGIAHVVTDPEREVLRAGEILVAPFTDPGWTPLFVHAVGLVTEVGGVMTHGAVVAREYGIPAVVSVSDAVERIKTGQRIRVDGTRGFVELLEAK
jgi:pyruvate,water dikinase